MTDRQDHRETLRFAHSDDHLRLMARIARMYHERGMRQSDIAAELHVSQARVSRLLKRAEEVGIVRTTVVLPAGVHTDLEESLEREYGLEQVIVVDVDGSEDAVVSALGSAAAAYLETTLTGGDRVGISSWSATLLATLDALRPFRSRVVDEVVQVVGGIGDPRVQIQATRLLSGFAALTGATAIFMPAPGLLGSAEARDSLFADESVRAVTEAWKGLTMALVGIGSLEPSPLLKESGNATATADQGRLLSLGAVGDVCLHYYDESGNLVDPSLEARVVGISATQMHQIGRRVGVAGGTRKLSAIRGAILGKWVNILITDVGVARGLLGVADRP
jgi:DNA-binding transcriptional regulator LsrR (DeoR family)